MQGKLFEKNYTSGKNAVNDASLKLINEWFQCHTEIWQEYLKQSDRDMKAKFAEKIEKSLVKGKLLVDSLSSEIKINKKPSIPLSGMNRFSSSAHEPRIEVRRNLLGISFKAELGTKTNTKKIPLPSRTYLKKN
ncbi:MAG: hypothetical protein DCC88_10155 [Spirobacillus cienkowskii]|jgi:hypothetical protein|uniref:Uncharacterized protein n=1 Tax=Spirobacillus cienkowskii TaxID=495820 RepID=A0A369KPG9_9BACT|nr:MAG: hypothetical protein DCC88_10155 [Spirobacillus cienkowskii]